MRLTRKHVTFGFVFFCWTMMSVLSGCSQLQMPRPNASSANALRTAPGNSYYYYIVSQLRKKEGQTDQTLSALQKAIQMDPDAVFLKKELALYFLQQGKTEEALPILEVILEKDPNQVETLIMLGSIRQNQNRKTEAQALFEKAIEADPERKTIYLTLGSMYIEENKYDEAETVFQKLTTQFPGSYFGYYFLGKINEEKGNLAKAEQNFIKTLDLEPNLLEPRFALLDIYRPQVFNIVKKEDITQHEVTKGDTIKKIARRYFGEFSPFIEETLTNLNPDIQDLNQIRTGMQIRLPTTKLVKNHPEAVRKINSIIRLFDEILDIFPENDRATIEQGLFLHKIGITGKADRIFGQIAEKSKSDQSIADNIVFLFFDSKRFTDAVIVLEGIIKYVPDSADMNHLLGAAYDRTNAPEKALKYFLKVGPESRFYENATIHIAFIYQSEKKLDKAIAHMRAAIEQNPDDTEFYLYLAAFHEEKEDYEKAEAVLKEGLGKEPNHERLMFRLGVVYDKWGKKDQSIEQMKRVIELNPQDAHALNYLGYTYLDLDRNLEDAEALIRKAVELMPDDGYITDSLGWLYYKQSNYEKALETLQKAVELVPGDPIILEHLGDAYRKNNNTEKALEYYRRALENKKKDKDTLEKKIRSLTQ